MQDGSTDPKKPGIRNNAADADRSQEKRPRWHTPLLQRLDLGLLTGANVLGARPGGDGVLALRS
jgi:hypothetical protein